MAHARLSPSNHRWPRCPGSVREEAAYPDIPGDAAIDGTGSHLLLEMCVQQEKNPADFIGLLIGANHEDKPSGWIVDKERAERVQMAISYLERRKRELFTEFPGCMVQVLSESKADPGGMFGRDDWHGTCDLTIFVWVDKKCVFAETIDYKDGREKVMAEANSQLLSYLGGMIRHIVASGPQLVRPFDTRSLQGTRITIVQPKTTPPVRYHDYTPSEVLDRLEGLGWRAHLTDAPDAKLIPGTHCRWCKHKPNCTEQSEQKVETLKTMTTEVTLVGGTSLFQTLEQTFGNIEELNDEQLSDLLDTRDGIMAIYQRVENEIQARLDRGLSVPGYKLLPGRGTNKWNAPEEEIAKVLKGMKLTKDEIRPPKLLSPAQALKMSKLTTAQRERLEKNYISYIAGENKLTKVAREEKSFDDLVSLFDKVEEPFSFL